VLVASINFTENRLLPIATRRFPHTKEAVVDVRRTNLIEPTLNQEICRPLAQHILGDTAEKAILAEALCPSFVVHRAYTLAQIYKK